MAAFLVHPEHIHVLIHAGLTRRYPGIALAWYYRDANNQEHYERLDPGTADRVGNMLLAANAASAYTDNEDDGTDPDSRPSYTYQYRQPQHTNWSPIEQLKALQCYQYQTCEPDNWPTCEAYAFCAALTQFIITKLPGYDNAPWAIGTSTTPAGTRQPAP